MKTRADFWRPTIPVARKENIDWVLCNLAVGEFVELVSRPQNRNLYGIPVYYTRTPEATYFWPKRAEDIEIVWHWEFDEHLWHRYVQYNRESFWQ